MAPRMTISQLAGAFIFACLAGASLTSGALAQTASEQKDPKQVQLESILGRADQRIQLRRVAIMAASPPCL